VNAQLPPIETAGGMIYPVDGLLIQAWPSSLAPFL
jgi:hypothetical protein